MDNITLEWKKVNNINNVRNFDDTEFYAFTQNNGLRYIGMAYKQDVADEIRQTIRNFNYNEDGINIWLGYINIDKSNYERITEEIVRDVESLLIYANTPSDNTKNINNYLGRDNLKVENLGCSKIKSCQCKNGKIQKLK